VTISGLVKRFGGLSALAGVDLRIEAGLIVGLIGPNGAGKTTLFNCLTGLYPFDDGEVLFGNRTLKGLKSHAVARLGISRTFQNIRLFNHMTALENVLVGCHCHLRAGLLGAIGRGRSTLREEATAHERGLELLRFVGLEEKADLLAKNLSYGDQRRLEIARALAAEPRLLLLDEPTAGMNPQETKVMTRFIARLRDERSLTIVLIEHDMRVVMGISDRVIVLDHGVKIAEGSPQEVQKNPRVIEAYLGRSGTLFGSRTGGLCGSA
jgi:branched-chain amino acid transport system ATP-binding protein